MNDLPNFPLEDFITREELIHKYQITLGSDVDIVDINILNKIKNECFLPKLKAMFKCRKDDNEFQDNQTIKFRHNGPSIIHCKDGKIGILLNTNAEKNYDIALFELAHETFHTLFDNKKGKYGLYLDEGLATLFQFIIKEHFQLKNCLEIHQNQENYHLALCLVCDLIKESKIFIQENNIIKSLQNLVKFNECDASHIIQNVPSFDIIKAKVLCSYFYEEPLTRLEEHYNIIKLDNNLRPNFEKIKQDILSKIDFSNDEIENINLSDIRDIRDIRDISSTPK